MPRPTKNNATQKQLKDIALKLAQEGYKKSQIVKFIGITAETLNKWEKADKKFSEALSDKKTQSTRGLIQDNMDRIISAQIKSATGYTYTDKRKTYDGGGNLVRVVEDTKHAPPSGTSAEFLIKQLGGDQGEDAARIRENIAAAFAGLAGGLSGGGTSTT